MNKVILTPKKAVNEEKMLKIGFYAVTAGLCGLLTGPAGCSLPKRDISVSLPAHNVLIRQPAPLTLPVENVVHANNKYHQNAYLVFTQTRCAYINKLKSLDTEIKQIEKISYSLCGTDDDFKKSNKNSWAKRIIDTSNSGFFQIATYVSQKKGGSNRKHYHPDTDEWWVVLKGKVEFEIGDNGKKYNGNPGDVIFCKKGIPHSITTVSDEPSVRLSVAIDNQETVHV